MDSFDQCAVLRMVSTGTPDRAAFEAAAPLVECALKVEVSTPALPNNDFIHLPIEQTFTGLFGFFMAENNKLALVLFLNESV